MAEGILLQSADYVVTTLMLLIPVGIGIYFAVKDSKNATRVEYFLGGRSMSMLPVALSIFVTFISAISLVGTPSDVYHYGGMASTAYLGFALCYVVGLYTMIPLMYPLHLTSLYEYLSLRFDSEALRICAVTIGMLQTICYMAIALTPALGLQAAAGIPLWMSVAIVGAIGTIYTTVGGIKSVVWTDAFQSFVMFAGIIAVIVKGSMTVGSASDVLSAARTGGRISFSQFNPDPRTRHSWWGTIIGGMFMWTVNIFSQSTIQRVCAMKTIKDAKKAFLINIPVLFSFGGLMCICGIVIYAYFFTLRCDPVEGGLIASRNQLTPYFVLHTLRDLPGMAGLFMATVFSGALSTISSGINALAANTVEDILRRPLLRVKESTATLITKIIAGLFGVLIICLAYAANSLKGPLTQIALSVFGACGGPITGVFFLGASFPRANKYGAFSGAITALIFTIWMAIGGQLYGKKDRILVLPPTDMCFSNFSITADNITSIFHLQNTTLTTTTNTFSGFETSLVTHKTDPYAFKFFLYDVSFEWYGLIGTIFSFTIGVIVSLCTSKFVKSEPNSKLIFPFARKIWSLSEPTHINAEESNFEKLKLAKLKLEEVKHMEITFLIENNKQETTEPSDHSREKPVQM
uniref:Sodium-coupled monocarboxylate transporter 1 n=1 Tax=Arion vulgaris TaxID=1028688 RepID=A0A0B6ZN73_9EUPU